MFQINPPYFVPLVEIIPAPFTKPEVTQKVRQLMEDIGQSPITLRREALGFALNRIQYACINECWNMYKVTHAIYELLIVLVNIEGSCDSILAWLKLLTWALNFNTIKIIYGERRLEVVPEKIS